MTEAISNPVRAIASQRLRSQRRFARYFFSPRPATPVLFLMTISPFMAFGLLQVGPAYPEIEEVLPFLTLSLLWFILTLVSPHLQNFTDPTGFNRIARSLRLPRGLFRSLIETPLGATEYVIALLAWKRDEFIRDAWLWSGITLILSPLFFLLSSRTMLIPTCVAAGFAGYALMRCRELRATTLSSVCGTLHHLRSQATGTPLASLPGDAMSRGFKAFPCACLATIPAALLVALLSGLYELFMFPRGDELPEGFARLLLLLFAISFGLTHSAGMSSLSRADETENRQAAWLHMDAMLVVFRERGAA